MGTCCHLHHLCHLVCDMEAPWFTALGSDGWSFLLKCHLIQDAFLVQRSSVKCNLSKDFCLFNTVEFRLPCSTVCPFGLQYKWILYLYEYLLPHFFPLSVSEGLKGFVYFSLSSTHEICLLQGSNLIWNCLSLLNISRPIPSYLCHKHFLFTISDLFLIDERNLQLLHVEEHFNVIFLHVGRLKIVIPESVNGMGYLLKRQRK